MRRVALTVGSALAMGMLTMSSAVRAADLDYSKALRMTVGFYDANRCGKDVARDSAFPWRVDCHTDDGQDVGVDLSGGFHDAGDHVKFGLTQGYSAAILGWTYLELPEALRKTGSDQKLLSTLRRFTDYFLKAHPKPDIFYYQVGDGGEDHGYWGPPEKQPGPRPTRRFADATHPASDILGETAAALALASIHFKSSDPTYAGRCLQAARELYEMGKKHRGVGDCRPFYESSSYLDDLAWGALWLHRATQEKGYLQDAKAFVQEAKKAAGKKDDPFHSKSTMNWDDVFPGVMLVLSEVTGEKKYRDAVTANLEYWTKSLKSTPGGLKWFAQWGVCRYAASASMLALLAARRDPAHAARWRAFAHSQIDYILGKNPAKLSYVIGFGDASPKDPHHRASVSCRYERGRTDADCVLNGALVGGPNEDDEYQDSMDMYQFSEVAIDYNAGLVGALAGIVSE